MSYSMGRPGKPNPLEARREERPGSSRAIAILVLIVALVFAGLIIWAVLD